jgi:4-hydroxy-2-oxoheptanedioate aldolase
MTSLLQGVWLLLGESRTGALVANAGFDWIGIDTQHGRFDDAKVLQTLDALPAGAPPCLVRVRSNDYGLIGRALDSGAAGVIVPMVESAEQATAAVFASNYPPVGGRSWGPMAGGYSTPEELPTSGLRCAVMIETPAALSAVASIACVPGIDMLFVGPFDLALALNIHVDDLLTACEIGDPLPSVIAAARSAGIVAGAFAGSPERGEMLETLGFKVVAVATEATLLERGSAVTLAH